MIFMEAFCQLVIVFQLTILMLIHLCGILGYLRARILLFLFYHIYFPYNTRNPITLDPSLASTNGNELFLLSNMATSKILSCPQPCYFNFPITNDLLHTNYTIPSLPHGEIFKISINASASLEHKACGDERKVRLL
jgi:hypothetical protein